jgi:hypothetical protein
MISCQIGLAHQAFGQHHSAGPTREWSTIANSHRIKTVSKLHLKQTKGLVTQL